MLVAHQRSEDQIDLFVAFDQGAGEFLARGDELLLDGAEYGLVRLHGLTPSRETDLCFSGWNLQRRGLRGIVLMDHSSEAAMEIQTFFLAERITPVTGARYDVQFAAVARITVTPETVFPV